MRIVGLRSLSPACVHRSEVITWRR